MPPAAMETIAQLFCCPFKSAAPFVTAASFIPSPGLRLGFPSAVLVSDKELMQAL
jgi:hypothetical protein